MHVGPGLILTVARDDFRATIPAGSLEMMLSRLVRHFNHACPTGKRFFVGAESRRAAMHS